MYYLKEANSLEQFEGYLKLKSQKDAILWSGFATAPDRERFLKYYKEKVLQNPNTHLMLQYDEDLDDTTIVGYVQYDDIAENEVEIRGSGILKSYQGTDAYQEQGNLLGKHFAEKGVKKLVTWASEKNVPSEFNLKRSGMHKTEEFEIRNIPLLGGEHRFFKWVLDI